MAMIAVAAIIAGASAAAAAAAVTTLAVAIGIGLAVAAVTGIMGYMAMQQSVPKMQSQDTGATIGTVTDPKTVLPVIYGRERVGTIAVWKNIAKNDDTKLVTIFAIAEGEIEGFHNMYLDNKRILREEVTTLKSGIVDSANIDPKYRGYLEIEFSTGGANGHHLELASKYLGQDESGWPINNVGKNVAMGCVVIRKTNDGLQDGVDIFNPNAQIGVELTGLKVRDLLDNTIKASTNGPSQLLDYMMNSHYGLGIEPNYIDVDSFKVGAKFASDNSFYSNGSMDPNAAFKNNITSLCGSFGGMVYESFGKLTLGVDAPDVVQYSFDEDNILQGMITLKDGESNGYYNTLNCTIRQPDADYSDIVYRYPSEIQNDEQINKDRRIITKDVDYRFIKSKAQLDKLASVERNKSILQQSISFNTADAYGVKVWDVIKVTNSELKLSNSLWRVVRVHRSMAGSVAGQIQIDAIEYNDKVYSQVDIAKDPNFNGSDIPDATILAVPENFKVQATGTTAYGQNIVLTWTAADDFNRYGFRLQYKVSGASEWVNAGFTSQKYFEIYGLNVAKYDFRVCATGIAARSEWATLVNQNPATSYALPGVTGLTLVNAMENATTTKATEFRFAWDDQSAQKLQVNGTEQTFKDLFKYYEIKVTGKKTVVYKTADTNFTYTWEQNVSHGLSRQVTIGITTIGYGGQKSPEVKMTVKNNQHPALTGFSAQAGIKLNGGMAFTSWTSSIEPDFSQVQIQVARDSNFTKEVSYHEATGSMLNFELGEGGWYIRAGAYDVFGTDGMILGQPTYLDIKYEIPFSPEDIKNIEDLIDLSEQLNETLGKANEHADSVADQAKKDAEKYAADSIILSETKMKEFTNGQVSASDKRTDTKVANSEKALNQKITEQDAKFTKQVGDLKVSTEASITEISKAQSDFESATTQKFTEQKAEYTDGINKSNSSIKTLDESVAKQNTANASRFSKIEANVGSNTASISRLDKVVVDNDKAQSQALTQVEAKLDGKIATVSNEAKASVDKLTGQVNASNSMTVDANGIYAGFKLLASDGPVKESAAIFAVNKFMIVPADKDMTKVKPVFYVDAPTKTVYMDNAMIKDASIGNAKIANASIDNAKIANGSINTAKISQEIGSDNWYSSGGTQGWMINKNGTAYFKQVQVKGHIEAESGYFKGDVYANNGVFNGTVNANSGVFNNGTFNSCVINENCDIRGKLRVNQIEGSVMDGSTFDWTGTNTGVVNYVRYAGNPYSAMRIYGTITVYRHSSRSGNHGYGGVRFNTGSGGYIPASEEMISMNRGGTGQGRTQSIVRINEVVNAGQGCFWQLAAGELDQSAGMSTRFIVSLTAAPYQTNFSLG